MENKIEIKPLLEFYSSISNPWGLFVDVAVSRFPILRVLNGLRKRVGKPDPRVIEIGFKGYELGLWSGSLFDKDWNIDQGRLYAHQHSKHPFHRFHACFEMMPRRLRGIYFNVADGRVENKKSLISQIDVTRALSTHEETLLVVHPGFVSCKDNLEKGLDNIRRLLDSTLSYAEGKKVIIALENLPYLKQVYFLGSKASELADIIDEFNSKYLKMTFDWGHMNIFARSMGIKDNFGYIDEQLKFLGSRVVHAHLNYNRCSQVGWMPSMSYGKLILRKIMRMFPTKEAFDLFSIDPLDEHAPLTRALDEYRIGIERNLKTLFEVSSIAEHGFVTHEIEPKKVFRFITHKSVGATIADHQNDLNLVKQVLSKVSHLENKRM